MGPLIFQSALVAWKGQEDPEQCVRWKSQEHGEGESSKTRPVSESLFIDK